MERRRVAVTGIGLITGVGLDRESTWSALTEGRSGIAPITAFDTEGYKLLLGRLHTLANGTDARPWSGAIDEVSLYDHALGSEEIKRHYQAAKR